MQFAHFFHRFTVIQLRLSGVAFKVHETPAEAAALLMGEEIVD